jgi:uncharacterized membrane protein YqhA
MATSEKKTHSMLQRAITWTRFLIYIPVVALFTGAVALVLVGGFETAWAVYRALFDGSVSEKETLVDFISLADLFLLATVLYIIALGLYELFIDDRLPLPQWLVVNDLNDLKEKLTGVVVVVLAVFFLGFVVKATDPMLVLWEGLGIASIILALSVFLRGFKHEAPKGGDEPPKALVHALEAQIAADEATEAAGR